MYLYHLVQYLSRPAFIFINFREFYYNALLPIALSINMIYH